MVQSKYDISYRKDLNIGYVLVMCQKKRRSFNWNILIPAEYTLGILYTPGEGAGGVTQPEISAKSCMYVITRSSGIVPERVRGNGHV